MPRNDSLIELVLHPWATLAKLQGLDRLPDRRVSQRRMGYGGSDPVDPLRRQSRIQSIYKALGVYALEESRAELYENFREMDSDPMIAAVLDEFGSAASERDPEHRRIVWAESANEDILKIVTATLDRLHIDQLAFPVQRALARDGDVFMHVAAARGQGVVALRAYEPWVVSRIEDDIGRLIGFSPADEQGRPSVIDRASVPHYRVLHFRLSPRELTDCYGAQSSFLWGSRLVWRQLQLMEDQVVIQRLLRRPDRVLVLMDTTGMSYDDAWLTVKDWERRLYREWYLNPQQSTFSSHGTPLDIAKDVVLPRGMNNSTEVTNFPATNTNDLLRDLDMFLNRLAAGIGFPLAFIGRGEAGGYQAGQSLARQHQPFARRSGRLQNAFLPEVTRLCMIDLAFKGLDPLHERNAFTLNMTSISPISEIERNEVIQLKTDRMERTLTLGQNAQLDLSVWIPYVLEKYGGLSRDLIAKLYKPKDAPEMPQGFRPPPPPAMDVSYSTQAEGRARTEDDEARTRAAFSEQVGKLIPETEENARFSSRDVQMPEERTHPWRPAELDESTGKGAAREDMLLEGNETRLGPIAELTPESRAEKHRERAKTRLSLIASLAGVSEEDIDGLAR